MLLVQPSSNLVVLGEGEATSAHRACTMRGYVGGFKVLPVLMSQSLTFVKIHIRTNSKETSVASSTRIRQPENAAAQWWLPHHEPR